MTHPQEPAVDTPPVRRFKNPAYAEVAPTLGALVARLNLLLCAGQLTGANQALIVSALNATNVTAASSATTKSNRVYAAVLLVMASAEYLVQK